MPTTDMQSIDGFNDTKDSAGTAKALRQAAKDALNTAKDAAIAVYGVNSPTATGTSQARSLQDRFSDIVNVKDFGAVGDGVADDTSAFSRAAATGKTVFVPEGRYNLSRKIHGTFISAGGASNTSNTYFDQIGLSLREIQNRVTNRLANRSIHVFDLYQQDGSNNWGYQSLQDIMQDSWTDLIYANFAWGDDGTDKARSSQMHVFRWNDDLKGYKEVASSDNVKLIFSHQGVSLYRPKPSDPVRFFGGTYGAPWVVLRLSSWDYTKTTTPVLERTWTLFKESEFYTAYSGGNCRLNVTLSPDLKKLAARGRRKSDNFYVYRVWDVQTLLNMEGDDATELYEVSVDNPWGTEEVDFQSLAFDGWHFYGLHSDGGYSSHKIKIWDVLGNRIYDRPNTMEGILENWTQRQFEGETLAFMRNEAGVYDLYLGVSVASKDWSSLRQACIYNLSARGSDKLSLLNGVQGSFENVDTAVDPGLWQGEQSAFGGLLSARGYLNVISDRYGKPTSVIQIAQRMYDAYQRFIRNGNHNDDNQDITWDDWLKFVLCTKDGVIPTNKTLLSLNRASASPEVLKFLFYGVNRGYFSLTSNFTEFGDVTKSLRFVAGGTDSKPTRLRLHHEVNTEASTEYHAFYPETTNQIMLGRANGLWTEVFAATGAINTSDENEKQGIEAYPDAVLDAWGDVQFRQFLFNDAVEKKGENARIHSGVIAQQIIQAFEKHNLDATKYALLCYDEWDDEYETIEIEDAPAEFDEYGNEVTPAKKHTEQKLITKAGSRYGIRYSEALCLEAAYQRRRADKLEERIKAIEDKLNAK